MTTTAEQLADRELMHRARVAVQIAIEKQHALNVPVIVYDPDTQKIYAIDREGNRTPVAENL